MGVKAYQYQIGPGNVMNNNHLLFERNLISGDLFTKFRLLDAWPVWSNVNQPNSDAWYVWLGIVPGEGESCGNYLDVGPGVQNARFATPEEAFNALVTYRSGTWEKS